MVERGYEESHNDIILTLSERDSSKNMRKKIIYQGLDKDNLDKVAITNTSKNVRENFQNSELRMWENFDFNHLKEDFEILQMNEFEIVLDSFIRILTIVNQLRINDENPKDICVIEKVLQLLYKKFNFIMIFIQE